MDNSQFFLDQRTADLGAKSISPTALRTLIQNAKNGLAEDQEDIVNGLLAAILATQSRCNGDYRIYPFSVGAGQQQQILTNNDNRVSAIISISTLSTTPVAGILLDQGPMSPSAADVATINRCIQVDTSIQTIMQFNVAPSNFLTMVSCNNIAVTGVILEAY